MKHFRLKFSLLIVVLFFIQLNAQAQDEFKIKDASGKTLMEVREEGVVVTKLSTTERIAFASNLSTDDSGILVYDTDTHSFWVWKSTQWEAIGGTDNLGNHTATQNINLGNFVLSPDGGDGGLKFETDGGVRVGQNTNDAAGGNSFIGGGVFNRTIGTAATSFIGGGSSNTTLGSLSFIAGGRANQTYGTFSFATGVQNQAKSYAESVFGTFATIYTPISSGVFDEADRIFVIGNGTTNSNRSNAVTVLKNGNVGIGPNVPTEALDVDGNVKATAFIGDGSGLTGISFTELDGDITNELQTISKSGNTITLSNGGGSFEDADSDATNELQTLEVDGVNLKISDGNNVGLPVARLGFDKNDEVQSFPNDDNYRNLAIATINLPLGDYLAISANATVRLTSGSGTDDFIYRIRITGNGCTNDPVDFPEHTYRPDEDSSDHDNFRQIHYQEYYNGVCFGNVTVRFQVKNTGDDPWEAQHSSILLTKTEL